MHLRIFSNTKSESRYRSRFTSKLRGFTLIEILVVIVILSILASLVVPNLIGRIGDARIAAARSDIQTIRNALNIYALDNFAHPSTSQGLAALVEKPTGTPEAHNWRRPYIDELPLDPWNNPYVYISPGSNSEFDLISLGADGKVGGEGENADIQK